MTEEAEDDLRQLIQYAGETWGLDRAREYAHCLAAAAERLAAYPGLGRARDDMAPGLRGHPVREYVIFYPVDDRAVTITRVLHTRVDDAGQFGGQR